MKFEMDIFIFQIRDFKEIDVVLENKLLLIKQMDGKFHFSIVKVIVLFLENATPK